MASCPACRQEMNADAAECARCGVIVAKWRARHFERVPIVEGSTNVIQHPAAALNPLQPARSGSTLRGVGVAIALGLLGGGAVVAGYWNVRVHPRLEDLRGVDAEASTGQPQGDGASPAGGRPDGTAPSADTWRTNDAPVPAADEPRPSDAEVEELFAQLRAGSFDTEAAAVRLAGVGRGEEARAMLEQMLWDENTFKRMHAEEALHQIGFPKTRDRYSTSFTPETGAEDTDLLELTAEMAGDELRASWNVWVGHELVNDRQPPEGALSIPIFARYVITVKGGTIMGEITKEYQAVGGENRMQGEVLAAGLGQGEYQVSVFIHVQYIKPDGGPMILNDSAGFISVER